MPADLLASAHGARMTHQPRPVCVSFTAVFVASVLLGLVVSPGEGRGDDGRIRVHCRANLSQQARVDPLESFGMVPSMHLHTPAGALAFSARATVRKMMRAPTSCTAKADHSMLWVPTPMTRDGMPARIDAFDYYLGNHGYHIRKPPPDGLRFIAGNPKCRGDYCPAIYICHTLSGSVLSLHTIPTLDSGCDTRQGAGYEMVIYSPGQCWRGGVLGEGMGAFTGPADITTDRHCHGQIVPFIELAVDVESDGIGGYLSSDLIAGTSRTSPGSTGHFDFVFGWRRRAMRSVIQWCLDRVALPPSAATCEEVQNRARVSSIYTLPSPDRLLHHPICVTGPACVLSSPYRRGQHFCPDRPRGTAKPTEPSARASQKRRSQRETNPCLRPARNA